MLTEGCFCIRLASVSLEMQVQESASVQTNSGKEEKTVITLYVNHEMGLDKNLEKQQIQLFSVKLPPQGRAYTERTDRI